LEEVFAWWNQFLLLQNSSELFSCDMETSGSVIVHILWFDKNSFVFDLFSHGWKKLIQSIFFCFSEFSGRFWIFNDFLWVMVIVEDFVDVSTKVCIINKSSSLSIFGQKLSDFAFFESEIKSTKAGSELYDKS
jgi:hypothetical protein